MVNSLLENYGGAHVHERNSNFSPGSEFQLRHTKQFVVHEGHNQTSAGDFTKHTSLGRLSAKQVAITIAIGPRVSLGHMVHGGVYAATLASPNIEPACGGTVRNLRPRVSAHLSQWKAPRSPLTGLSAQ
jgi:hypothetical protein